MPPASEIGSIGSAMMIAFGPLRAGATAAVGAPRSAWPWGLAAQAVRPSSSPAMSRWLPHRGRVLIRRREPPNPLAVLAPRAGGAQVEVAIGYRDGARARAAQLQHPE